MRPMRHVSNLKGPKGQELETMNQSIQNNQRIEVTMLTGTKGKVIIFLSGIAALTKLAAPEGSGMFSGGTQIVLKSGTVLKVRDFYSVVDFLIYEALTRPQEHAHKYFQTENPDQDERYTAFKTLSGRDVPQEAEEALTGAEADTEPF